MSICDRHIYERRGGNGKIKNFTTGGSGAGRCSGSAVRTLLQEIQITCDYQAADFLQRLQSVSYGRQAQIQYR
jgi:hypothetical protein